jgi:glucose-6-phosphate 1-dehydrogenase
MSPPTTGTVASPSTLGDDLIAPPSPIESPQSHAPAQAKTVAGGCLSVVILGASGDLAKKKTFPAIFNLYKQGFLPNDQLQIFGYARSKMTSTELHNRLRGYLKSDRTDPTMDPTLVVNQFLSLVTYISGPYDEESGYVKLNEQISSAEEAKCGTTCSTRRLFYLALPPSIYPIVSAMVRKHCMNPRMASFFLSSFLLLLLRAC